VGAVAAPLCSAVLGLVATPLIGRKITPAAAARIGSSVVLVGLVNATVTESVGQAAGPGIGGLLTQVTGAANALAVTGLGYLSSAALISRIREPAPPLPAEQARLRTEIGEGLRCITAHRSYGH
jgi:hypothetical protein